MEIERTFIIEAEKSFPTDRRFEKVYLADGKYFVQGVKGEIKEISEHTFNERQNRYQNSLN